MRCWRCGMRLGLNTGAAKLKGGAIVEACSRCLTAWHDYASKTEEYLKLMEAERRRDIANCAVMGGTLRADDIPNVEFRSVDVLDAGASLYRLSVEFFKPNDEARKENLETEAALRIFERDRPELG